MKIAAELKDSSAKNVLYIMDEPTTGLHVEDIKKLLAILQKLVNSGNTVVVVEHNLDVIKSADWIIDLGPEGGSAGGHIVAEGQTGTRWRRSWPLILDNFSPLCLRMNRRHTSAYNPGRFSAVRDISIGCPARRTSNWRVCPAST